MMQGENEVVLLHLDDIIPNRFQPREIFDEKALKELAISIKEHGVIQPIIVRNIGNKYEIIAGERRYKASALAGLTKIPAIIRNLDDKESSKVALLENLQRKNLNPIEEARTYQKILELDQMTQEELAKTMGKSQGAVANKLRLLSLSEAVQDAVLKEQISERHARSLLSIENPEEQKKMLKKVIDKKMTVRELENEINPPKEKAESSHDLQNASSINMIPDQNPPIMPFQGSTSPQTDDTSIIDYSTPPKFINYGLEEEEDIGDIGESSAINTPDIDALRQNAQDIHQDTMPAADLDSLLQVGSETQEPPQETFKFIRPSMEENSPIHSSINEDLFKVPDLVPTNNINTMNQAMNPFQIPDIQSKGISSQLQEEKPSSPIEENGNHYTMKDAIEEVRNTIDKLEQAGIHIEKEEMDFDKDYQIVIRFMKDQIEE